MCSGLGALFRRRGKNKAAGGRTSEGELPACVSVPGAAPAVAAVAAGDSPSNVGGSGSGDGNSNGNNKEDNDNSTSGNGSGCKITSGRVGDYYFAGCACVISGGGDY